MSSPLVHLTVTEGVATVALADPARRNALSTAMFEALDAALIEVRSRDDVRVLHLRGEGPAFCTGFDLGECVADPTRAATFIRRLSAIARLLRRMPIPVVTEVNGHALAGGCALIAAGDLACASRDAKFGYPVHRIGITPAVNLPTLLADLAGAARGLSLSGELIDAETAARIGLVDRLADDHATLRTMTDDLCRQLASHTPGTMAATKAFLNECDGTDRDERFVATAASSATLADGDECRRMLSDFWAASQAAKPSRNP
jgi:enoyl-CoA hydratase/carnithine racemase